MSTTVQCPLGDKCPGNGNHFPDSATYHEHQRLAGGGNNNVSMKEMNDQIMADLSSNSDFMSADDWKDQQYDRYEEEVTEALEGFSEGADDRYISFIDEDGKVIDSSEVISDHAYEMSESGEHSGHVMVIEICNTGDELVDAANMQAIGIEPGREPSIPSEWTIKDDNIHVPVHWMVKNSDSTDLEDMRDNLTSVREYNVISDVIYSQLDYEGKRNAISEVDREQYTYDAADREMTDYEGNDDISDSELERMRESREESYREALTPENIRRAIDDMLQEGEIDHSDLEYHASSGRYDMDNYTTEQVIERVFRDNI